MALDDATRAELQKITTHCPGSYWLIPITRALLALNVDVARLKAEREQSTRTPLTMQALEPGRWNARDTRRP